MLTKKQVGFESPAKGSEHCRGCVHFEKRRKNGCAIVAGFIQPGDWCRKYEPMPATSKAQQTAMAVAEHDPKALYKRNRSLLRMSKGQLHDFAATKRKNLPEKAEKHG